ncbi:conserved hypothetical protein [Vibrio crassostreae]|nr:hypothetical protein [Vibrio crassostreae]TCN76067.1 hypothetical protein EDB37_106416 [Vibrio crassostreae]CAK2534784.1 conserved hypothetical protein [Vibrio crassostreae]CAK2537426.1 conserved hypothetical protein [Vibrio crassostreae]CAK3897532.1 conserved hypothetical protein [Vibrio crassostreae]CAK4023580.1 conserved hypothetical protein [Vibrio crassostreae]
MNQNDYIGKTLKPWPILVDHYSENTWKLYGYNSHDEYKKDLRNSLRHES